MTASEQLAHYHQRLNTLLIRKEELTGELEPVNMEIRALRNAIEGARLGAEALGERLKAQAVPPEPPPAAPEPPQPAPQAAPTEPPTPAPQPAPSETDPPAAE